MIGLSFGDTDLQANGITVTETDIYSPAANSIQADELAEADGALIVKQRQTSKKFYISGMLRAATIADMDALCDTFKLAMNRKNQQLDIDHGGGTRRYLATAQNVTISRERGQTIAGFTVNFLSPDGVGWDIDSASLLATTAVTSASSQLAITNGGSYKAEPLITVTVSAVTGGTTKRIVISNDETLRGITVTRTWTAGDVLEIDCYKKTLYVNNVPTEFTGQFPSWEPGTGIIKYLDEFTTRTVSVRADYTPRWL